MTIKTHGRMFTDDSVGPDQMSVDGYGTDNQALVTDGAGTIRWATVGVGGSVGSSTYVEDIRVGNGTVTKFTDSNTGTAQNGMSASAAVEESILVFVDGVAQPTSTFTLTSSGSGVGAGGALDEINISPALATGQQLRICHLGINTAIADKSITGPKITMGPNAPGDLIYFNGTDYQRLGVGTASQHLATNSGATAPEWVTPTTYATTSYVDTTVATVAGNINELIYFTKVSPTVGGTWTKPAGVNRIFLYITDRISNYGAAQAHAAYYDVSAVTSWSYTVYTYGNPTAYGALTLNGVHGGTGVNIGGHTPAQTVAWFEGRFPGPPVGSLSPGSFYIEGYAV